MGKYILKRILLMIPVILGVVILVFTLMQLTPGDPAEVILGTTATSEQIEELRGELGLNDPYIVQLLRYMKEVFIQFDFGTSYISKNLQHDIPTLWYLRWRAWFYHWELVSHLV